MTRQQYLALVAQLAKAPTAVLALLRAHQPDANRLCRGCGRPGYGTPYRQWPCSLYRLAQGACAAQPVDGADASQHRAAA